MKALFESREASDSHCSHQFNHMHFPFSLAFTETGKMLDKTKETKHWPHHLRLNKSCSDMCRAHSLKLQGCQPVEALTDESCQSNPNLCAFRSDVVPYATTSILHEVFHIYSI